MADNDCVIVNEENEIDNDSCDGGSQESDSDDDSEDDKIGSDLCPTCIYIILLFLLTFSIFIYLTKEQIKNAILDHIF